MLTTQAFFERKVNAIKYSDCVIGKVIKLSSEEFDSFSNNLLRDRDFIRDNAEFMGYVDGKIRCLLVTGENRQHGILVDSSGYDYARYSALLPNVDSFLTAGRYPLIAELNKKLVDIVDYIAELAVADREKDLNEGQSIIDIEDLENKFNIDFGINHDLFDAIINMFEEYEDIGQIEVDDSDLIIHWKPSHLIDTDIELNAELLSPLEEILEAANIKHPSLGEVFELTKVLIDTDDFMVEKAKAILSSGLVSIADVPTLIDFLDEDNIYRFKIINANNTTELGQYWVDEMPDAVPEGMTAEEYGRLCVIEEKGVFTKWGYIYERECVNDETSFKANMIIHDGEFISVKKAIEQSKGESNLFGNNRKQDKVKHINKGGDAL